MSKFTQWVIDTLIPGDIIDLYFVISDLFDFKWKPGEYDDMTHCDAIATAEVSSFMSGLFSGDYDFPPKTTIEIGNLKVQTDHQGHVKRINGIPIGKINL